MWTKTILRVAPLFGLLALGACSGGGEEGGGDDGPPTPVTITDYTVDFSPAHVVNGTAVPETVTATASLQTRSGDDNTASGTVTVTGTTATTVTVNVGYAGENGSLAVTLTDSGGGNWSIPSGTELSTDELRRLQSTGYYVRIQSADGELRGQILPPGWAVGTISLDADSVVPESTSTGSAKAGFAINPSTGSYFVRVTLVGITDATSSGIRDAIAGGVGDLVSLFEESVTTAGVWGSRDINDANANDRLTTTGIERLVDGRFYISVESASNPDGDLRGQIIDESILVFDANLTATEVVTGGAPVVSTAEGRATVTWVEALSRLGVAVNTDANNVVSVGVYEGVAGENGTFLFSLIQNSLLTQNWQFLPSDISAEQAAMLENGNLYVSINTAANSGGELRGQLFPDDSPDIQVSVAAVPAETKTFDDNGGTLSYRTIDDVQYDFIVPSRAIVGQDLEIAASEVLEIVGMPLDYQVVSALDFGPDGTSFFLQPTLRVDLSAVMPPDTPVFPLLLSADGSRTQLLFNLARDSGGNALPNVYDVLVPHFSTIMFPGTTFICYNNPIKCVTEGSDGNVGVNYGNGVANSVKKEIQQILKKMTGRNITGGNAEFTEEELRKIRDLLREWEDSVNIRINVLEEGGFSDRKLKDLIAGDALEREATRQMLGFEDASSGFDQAETVAKGYDDYVAGLCNTVGPVDANLRGALDNVALLQMLGNDQGSKILQRMQEDGTVCPTPRFDSIYTVSASGPILNCEDESFSESLSMELYGGLADTGNPEIKRVSLSGQQGVVTNISVEFDIRMDDLGRIVEVTSPGSGNGTFNDGESSGSFSYSGSVTLRNASGFEPRFGFSLTGTGFGSDGECSGTAATFQIR